MNRFDRVTAILLILQGRSVITAGELAERFAVTERTIYRDIRSLEAAGVPIGAEPGVGYFLERGYTLPPVSFTLDEASALLLGEKLLGARVDSATREDFRHALSKVRAVVSRTDNDMLSALDHDTAVLPHSSLTTESAPVDSLDVDQHAAESTWLPACRHAVVHRCAVDILYRSAAGPKPTARVIEPIGIVHYGDHWHLIAWCRLRCDYRDFRLDRVTRFSLQKEVFTRHSRLTLQQYFNTRSQEQNLLDVELLFRGESVQFIGWQRYSFGLVDESPREDGVHMRFLTHLPEYMARWLMQFSSDVEVLKGAAVRDELRRLTAEAYVHWHRPANEQGS